MDVAKFHAMTLTSLCTNAESVMEQVTKHVTVAMALERFKVNPFTQDGKGNIQLTSL